MMSYHSVYYQNHKEKIKEQARTNYLLRKDKPDQPPRKRTTHRTICECGTETLSNHHARHKRSQKHQDWAAAQPRSAAT